MRAPLRLGFACSTSEQLALQLVTAAPASGREIEPQDSPFEALLRHLQAGEGDAIIARLSEAALPAGISGRVIATDRLGVFCPAARRSPTLLCASRISPVSASSVSLTGCARA